MFSFVESKKDIAQAQRKLEATIRRDFTKTSVKNIGHPGGTRFDAKVCTDGRHWFWSADRQGKNARRLNWFGLFRSNADLQISVEINTPYKNRNDRVNGFFGRDSKTGAIYLLHSGRPGGSTRGVGKSTFLAWSNEALTDVLDSSGYVRAGVVVMPIEGRTATRSATRYVDVVADFKLAVRAGQTNTPEVKSKQKLFDDFYAEARGHRKGRRSKEIDYLSRHGDVVDALNIWRNARSLAEGARSVKNVLFDLGISVGSDLIEVYEVKTSASRSLIYSAIGQLLVHGTADRCQRFIVLPDKEVIAPDLSGALQRLGIKLLRFRLDKARQQSLAAATSLSRDFLRLLPNLCPPLLRPFDNSCTTGSR
jgi:hypothetical protein